VRILPYTIYRKSQICKHTFFSIDDYFVITGNNSAVHGSGRISYNEEFSFDRGNNIRMCDKISVDIRLYNYWRW